MCGIKIQKLSVVSDVTLADTKMLLLEIQSGERRLWSSFLIGLLFRVFAINTEQISGKTLRESKSCKYWMVYPGGQGLVTFMTSQSHRKSWPDVYISVLLLYKYTLTELM